jgi:hypothetical protein
MATDRAAMVANASVLVIIHSFLWLRNFKARPLLFAAGALSGFVLATMVLTVNKTHSSSVVHPQPLVHPSAGAHSTLARPMIMVLT